MYIIITTITKPVIYQTSLYFHTSGNFGDFDLKFFCDSLFVTDRDCLKPLSDAFFINLNRKKKHSVNSDNLGSRRGGAHRRLFVILRVVSVTNVVTSNKSILTAVGNDIVNGEKVQ